MPRMNILPRFGHLCAAAFPIKANGFKANGFQALEIIAFQNVSSSRKLFFEENAAERITGNHGSRFIFRRRAL